jgi:hypothetical protein
VERLANLAYHARFRRFAGSTGGFTVWSRRPASNPCGDQGQPPPVHAQDQESRVTVPGKLSADLQPGTLKSILRQAGFKD